MQGLHPLKKGEFNLFLVSGSHCPLSAYFRHLIKSD